MITPTQMRAARAMLDFSQGEVAKSLGIAANTLSNIESGKTDVPASRLKEMQSYYEAQGIAFTEQGGVNPKTSDIIIYEGVQGFKSFMDDVYETAKHYGGGIYLFNSRPKLWYEWLGKEWYDMHSDRMKKIDNKIEVKITLQEGDDFLILGTAQHRWFPKALSKDKIFYAYGPKLGFLDFSDDELKISVVNQKDFADIFRVLYDIAWEQVAYDRNVSHE